MTEAMLGITALLITVAVGDQQLDLVAGCRDRFLEPFSSTSIWNTAIGRVVFNKAFS